MPRLSCPGCAAVVDLPDLNRSSEEFCPACDFPLFWAGAGARPDEEGSLALAVRRRPGTAGHTLVATETCPECQELNKPTAVYCARCGAELHRRPAPVEPLADTEPATATTPYNPPLPPAPAPVDASRPWWRGWLLVALLFFLLAAVAMASLIVLALDA